MIPPVIQAHQSARWEAKDKSGIKDFQVMQKTTDWSFQTPYKGNVHLLKDYQDKLFRDLQMKEEDRDLIKSKI